MKFYLNKSQKIPVFRSTVLICQPSSLESLVTVRTLQRIKEGEYEETRKKRKNDKHEKVCQYDSREKEEK